SSRPFFRHLQRLYPFPVNYLYSPHSGFAVPVCDLPRFLVVLDTYSQLGGRIFWRQAGWAAPMVQGYPGPQAFQIIQAILWFPVADLLEPAVDLLRDCVGGVCGAALVGVDDTDGDLLQ